jgi:hypothetical protein
MKTVATVVSMFFCCVSLKAQITSSLVHAPDGRDEVRIRNASQTALAAFAVAARSDSGVMGGSGFLVIYSDTVMDAKAQPLLPGEERQVLSQGMVRPASVPSRPHGPNHGLAEPVAAAGIFVDGSTTGDAALLTRLLLRRSNMLAAVENAIDTLADAGNRNVPRAQLIDRFKKLSDSLSRWYLSQDQQIGRSVYLSIAGKLVDLPEEPLGSPFPPASFVREESAMLIRQRAALMASQPNLGDTILIEK